MKYYLPTQIILGKWEEEIKDAIDSFCAKKLLFVMSGSFFMEEIGKIKKILNGCEIKVFDKISPNPSPEIIQEAKISAQGADLIIGFGGGSAMDAAKMIARDLKLPCLEIPTTAGTGSEITPFAALYTQDKKQSCTPGYPTMALVDWRLSATMPREVAASSGLDALSQAIEAYWNVNSNSLTDLHAKEAIRLASQNLEKAVSGDDESREKMSLAALEAGMAFSQTKTSAPHSVAYPFTIFYKISHGFACALTLPYFLIYNSKVSAKDCAHPKGSDFVRQRTEEIAFLMGASTVDAAKQKILNIMENVGALRKVAFDEDLIVKNGFSPERMINNPRRVTEADLRIILKNIKK